MSELHRIDMIIVPKPGNIAELTDRNVPLFFHDIYKFFESVERAVVWERYQSPDESVHDWKKLGVTDWSEAYVHTEKQKVDSIDIDIINPLGVLVKDKENIEFKDVVSMGLKVKSIYSDADKDNISLIGINVNKSDTFALYPYEKAFFMSTSFRENEGMSTRKDYFMENY